MAIDESAGIRDRKDKVLKTWTQSNAMARLLVGPEDTVTTFIRYRTFKALQARGWAVCRRHPEISEWAHRYHITDAGRAVAEASPAVREWIEEWEYCQKH